MVDPNAPRPFKKLLRLFGDIKQTNWGWRERSAPRFPRRKSATVLGNRRPMERKSGVAILRCFAAFPGIFFFVLFILLFISGMPGAGAVWISLPASGTKCVSEEIQPNVVVLAEYSMISEESSHDHPTISTKVTSPYGNTLHHQEKITGGQFAFTTSEAGNYLACFWIDSGDKGVGANVNLDWKTGIAARDWDSVARKEKIEGVELELRKLEAQVQAIHQNLLYLKSREADMREVSEKTNARVAWLSIMSVGVCIVVSILQLWHLKTFFQKKKLI